ncbi:ankyrin repeat-containing domain protein [Tricharina praecox]|uniref:ankyrin repeat-containing domain protein n=1 Tax=Tricharina praecox TaxID=43433 RepID=UPI00221E9218|nr:ankyrin repeat-containing domain protein [Tricharina praecox]KAI5849229.1 ankyrin repeat-containing domain protein [Tricharina praecox]
MPSRNLPLTPTSIPVELLLQIADNLCPEDVHSLCRATIGLSDTLEDYFYQRLLNDYSQSQGLALTWACAEGHAGVVRFLLNHADSTIEHPIPLPDDLISYHGPEAGNPLIVTVRADRGCIIRIFRWNVYTRKVGTRPDEPLDSRERARRVEIVQLLLVRGVNFDGVDDNQKSALHYCSQYGESELCYLLLMCGAKASAFDYGHLTPLHLAVTCNRSETLRVLLGFESVRRTIDMGTEDDDTALILAAEAGYIEIVTMLLEHGANFNLRNFTGDSPLSLAELNGNHQIVGALRSFGARHDNELMTVKELVEEEDHQGGKLGDVFVPAPYQTIGSNGAGGEGE